MVDVEVDVPSSARALGRGVDQAQIHHEDRGCDRNRSCLPIPRGGAQESSGARDARRAGPESEIGAVAFQRHALSCVDVYPASGNAAATNSLDRATVSDAQRFDVDLNIPARSEIAQVSIPESFVESSNCSERIASGGDD